MSALDDVCAALRGGRFRFADEDQLQEAVATALEPLGVQREVRLGARDRLDHLVDGGVAVEIKVAGPADSVRRQLERYALHDEVEALVLVTTRSRHAAFLPDQVGGKPLQVVYLGASGL